MYFGIQIFDDNSLSVNVFPDGYVELEEEDAKKEESLIDTSMDSITVMKRDHLCAYFKSRRERDNVVNCLLENGDYLGTYTQFCNGYLAEESKKRKRYWFRDPVTEREYCL